MQYFIGDKRQISVKDDNSVTIGELGTQKSITLNANRWTRFVQLLSHLEASVNCLLAKQFVDFRQHIGGGCFVSVFSGYDCVNIRQYYFHPVHGIKPCKFPGIASRIDEFNRLKNLIPTINKDFPDLAATQPCTLQQDHKTLDGMMNCVECQPFHGSDTISACPYIF